MATTNIANTLQVWGNNLVANALDALTAIAIIVVFFIIGYIVAWIVCKAIGKAIKVANVEKIFNKNGIPFVVAGFKISGIILFLIKTFIVLAFLGASTQLITTKYSIIPDVINGVVAYIPSLLQGVILIIVAMVFANYLRDLIVKSRNVPLTHMVAAVMQIFIGYAAVVIALPMILPSANVMILEEAFKWFVASAGIALGIGIGVAIGFGLKESVKKAADKHPMMFDYLFGEVEKSVKGPRKR